MPRFERRRAGGRQRGVTQIYPSSFATDRRYPSEGPRPGAGEDAETDAVKCAQCAAPIESAAALNTCWNCGSDNFLGRRFSR